MRDLKLNEELKATDKCVSVFGSHTLAEEAVRELGRADFDMAALSILGQDYHSEEHVVGFYNAGDRVRHWGKLGAFWGGLFGLLLAPAFFWIPGVGPVLTGGVIGSALMGMIEGGVFGAAIGGGMSALGAAFASIGIPEDSVLIYQSAVKAGKFVLMVHGTAEEVAKAKKLLSVSAEETSIHKAA